MEISLEEFINQNQGFLHNLASFYSNTNELGIEFEDLYQVGCLALIEKYNSYDKEKGSMSTYSYWVIKGAMLNYINSNNTITYVPIQLNTLLINLTKKNSEFYKSNGRNMNNKEILDYLKTLDFVKHKITPELVTKLKKIYKYHLKNSLSSLDDANHNYLSKIDYNTDVEIKIPIIKDSIDSNYDLEEEVINKIRCEEILKMCHDISEIDYEVIVELYGFNGHTHKTTIELAEKCGVTPQRISQRHIKTLKKIRDNLENQVR